MRINKIDQLLGQEKKKINYLSKEERAIITKELLVSLFLFFPVFSFINFHSNLYYSFPLLILGLIHPFFLFSKIDLSSYNIEFTALISPKVLL